MLAGHRGGIMDLPIESACSVIEALLHEEVLAGHSDAHDAVCKELDEATLRAQKVMSEPVERKRKKPLRTTPTGVFAAARAAKAESDKLVAMTQPEATT